MNSLTIYVNNECNLDCTYCQVNKSNIKLDWSEWLKNLLENLVQNDGDNKKIWLMWWEPLLNKELIIQIIDYTNVLKEKYKKNISITAIPTNGTIFDKELYEKLRDNNIELQFSIDNYLTNKKDENRIHKDIKDYNLYDIIEKNIGLYKEIYWKSPRINITVNDKNIDELYGIVKYYIEEIKIRSVNIFFVVSSPNRWWFIGLKFIKQYKKVLEYYTENVIKDEIEINPIEDVIKEYLTDNFSIDKLNWCWLWREPVLSYNWIIYSCSLMASKWINNPNFKYIIWDLENWINYKKLEKWFNEMNEYLEKSKTTDFKWKLEVNRPFCLTYWVPKEQWEESKLIFTSIYQIPFTYINKLSPEIIMYIKNKYWIFNKKEFLKDYCR